MAFSGIKRTGIEHRVVNEAGQYYNRLPPYIFLASSVLVVKTLQSSEGPVLLYRLQ